MVSPPLSRRSHSSTSLSHCRSRWWPAEWHSKTPWSLCAKCVRHSHGDGGPLSLRSSLLNSWGPLRWRSRSCCQHHCASRHHLVRGCRWKLHCPFMTLGDNTWSVVTPAYQPVCFMGYRTPVALLPSTSVEMAQSPPVAQYRVPMPPLKASPLGPSSPLVLDIEEPLDLLSWAEQVELEEAEAAAQATAFADVLLKSLTDGHGLPSTPADHPLNPSLVLWGLVVQCRVSLLDAYST